MALRCPYLLAILALAVLAPVAGYAQLTPSAPISNFRLPMFGEDGYRIWELSGKEGRYMSADKIEVSLMKLKIFSGDAKHLLEHQIDSPKATLFVNKNIAIGEGPIQITASSYRVNGERWFWDGKTRSIVVSQKASVVFFENISL